MDELLNGIRDIVDEAKKQVMEKQTATRGLYCRYDGSLVVVLSSGACTAWTTKERMLEYFEVGEPDKTRFASEVEFFSDKYKVLTPADDGISFTEEWRPISEHPDNVTGQGVCHFKLEGLHNPLAGIPTIELVGELVRRKDSPLCGLDVAGELGKVVYTDYPVAVHGYDSRGEFMVAESVWTTEEEARGDLSKYGANTGMKVYKRTYSEAN